MHCNRLKLIKWFVLLIGISIIIFLLELNSIVNPIETIRIQPPKPTFSQLSLLNSINWDSLRNSSRGRIDGLEVLSSIVQSQLNYLQRIAPVKAVGERGDDQTCDKLLTIQCGHWQDCGFACQVHHRIACLMISYALNIPLIHDQISGWSYKQKWGDVFEPLGSDCVPGPNTFNVQWTSVGELPLIYRKNCTLFCSTDAIYHPLDGGLPVPRELGELVELLHEDPWLWWIGQFMKYGLRLKSTQRAKLEQDKKSINFPTTVHSPPFIGFQVRRTDKIIEASDSSHPIEQYFDEATIYYQKLTGETEINNKSVFIASDDHLVLQDAAERFESPEWNVYSFPSNKTLTKMLQRTNDLYSIVRDIIVLAEDCDYIICGFSSNICRLLLEMLSSRFMDPKNHVKSLDG